MLVGTVPSSWKGLAVLSSGKIALAGDIRSGYSYGIVSRLESWGALDATFDEDGHIFEPASGFNRLLVQTNGAIIAGGSILAHYLPTDTPGIAVQPIGGSATTGTSFSLSISVSGTPAPAVQWYRGLPGDTANPLIGGTAAQILTAPLTSTTSFWARVSSSAGYVDSGTAIVTILKPPVFATQPAGRYSLPGTTVMLTASASGSPAPAYQWYLGNSGSTANPVSGAITGTLSINATTSNQAYWVRATNAFGTADSSTAQVAVGTAPAWTALPPNVTILLGPGFERRWKH